MDKAEAEVQEGQQAARILNDEVFRGAVDQVSADLYAAWAESKWWEVLKREFIYRQFRSLDLLEKRLKISMDTGKVAQSAIDKTNR